MNYDDLCRFQQVKSEGNRSKGLGEGDVDIGIAVVAVVGSRKYVAIDSQQPFNSIHHASAGSQA